MVYDFSGIEWSKEKLIDRDFLLKTLDICIKKAEDALTGQGDMSGDELVFISNRSLCRTVMMW